MFYAPIIQKSISFAIKVHELDAKKRRKGTEIPYVIHPLAIGMILARVTQDENIIAAGILHDTIEDCEPYGCVTRESLETEFNADVARMVDDVTEKDKTMPWIERKTEALMHIPHMKHDSLLVKTADVLHNLTDLVDDIRANGQRVFDKFNASKSDTVTRYRKLETELTRVWPENPLLTDLHTAMKNFLGLIE